VSEIVSDYSSIQPTSLYLHLRYVDGDLREEIIKRSYRRVVEIK
jgi:hypothetical protein